MYKDVAIEAARAAAQQQRLQRRMDIELTANKARMAILRMAELLQVDLNPDLIEASSDQKFATYTARVEVAPETEAHGPIVLLFSKPPHGDEVKVEIYPTDYGHSRERQTVHDLADIGRYLAKLEGIEL